VRRTISALLLIAATSPIVGCSLDFAESKPVYRAPPTMARATPPPPPTETAPIAAPPAAVATAPLTRARTGTGHSIDPFWLENAASAPRTSTPSLVSIPTNGGDNNTDSNARPAATHAVSSGAGAEDVMEGLAHVTFAAEGADFDPCISHDGTFMVYASTQHRSTPDIYLKSINGRTITQLTADPAQDLMPSISPDGQRIAFASNRTGNWDIFVMSVAGGQAVQLTTDPAHDVSPTWSSDGARIAFCRLGQVSNRWEIWVTEVNGSASEFVAYGLFPRWCPKAGTAEGGRDKILFQRSRERGDRAFSIWTIDYKPGDASSPTEIVSGRNSAMINASWSPDGTHIVYSTIENPNSTTRSSQPGAQTSDLWIAALDGNGRVNLTSGRFMNLMPCWGADNRIYFVSDRSGTSNVWSVGTDKAIMAATGHAPTNPSVPKHEVANTPEEHENDVMK